MTLKLCSKCLEFVNFEETERVEFRRRSGMKTLCKACIVKYKKLIK